MTLKIKVLSEDLSEERIALAQLLIAEAFVGTEFNDDEIEITGKSLSSNQKKTSPTMQIAYVPDQKSLDTMDELVRLTEEMGLYDEFAYLSAAKMEALGVDPGMLPGDTTYTQECFVPSKKVWDSATKDSAILCWPKDRVKIRQNSAARRLEKMKLRDERIEKKRQRKLSGQPEKLNADSSSKKLLKIADGMDERGGFTLADVTELWAIADDIHAKGLDKLADETREIAEAMKKEIADNSKADHDLMEKVMSGQYVGLSMGCKVEVPVCSLCEDSDIARCVCREDHLSIVECTEKHCKHRFCDMFGKGLDYVPGDICPNFPERVEIKKETVPGVDFQVPDDITNLSSHIAEMDAEGLEKLAKLFAPVYVGGAEVISEPSLDENSTVKEEIGTRLVLQHSDLKFEKRDKAFEDIELSDFTLRCASVILRMARVEYHHKGAEKVLKEKKPTNLDLEKA